MKSPIITKKVFAWALYDWANSSFATTVMVVFFPLFFKQYLTPDQDSTTSTFWLGIANGVSSFVLAIMAPWLGALADRGGKHLRFLAAFTAIGVIPTAMLAAMRDGVRRSVVAGRRFIHHNDQDALNLWLLRHDVARPVPALFNQFEVGRFLERGDWVRRVIHRPLRSTGAALLHYVGPNKPWLPGCPTSEDVRTYRAHLLDATRRVRRLGDLGISTEVPT